MFGFTSRFICCTFISNPQVAVNTNSGCYQTITNRHTLKTLHSQFIYLQTLVPDLEEAVPGPCCHCHAVVGHTQAAHPVIMTSQDTCRDSTDWDTDLALSDGYHTLRQMGKQDQINAYKQKQWVSTWRWHVCGNLCRLLKGETYWGAACLKCFSCVLETTKSFQAVIKGWPAHQWLK